jgi:hypothetical protein
MFLQFTENQLVTIKKNKILKNKKQKNGVISRKLIDKPIGKQKKTLGTGCMWYNCWVCEGRTGV